MVTKAFILFAADPRPGVHPLGVDALWRIGCVQGEMAQIHEVPIRTDAPPDTIAEMIHAGLLELGHQRESVALAIPSSMSLCASVRSVGLPARGRQSALMYRLEEHLPVSAEEVTADFAPAGDEMSLGVCVQNDSLAPLIESLAAKNIAIASISPTALLALQYESANKAGLDADALLIGQEDEIELFQLKKGAPLSWYTVSQDLGAVLLHLKGREENPDRSLRVYAVGMLRPLVDALMNLPGIQLTGSRDDSIWKMAAKTGALVLAGRQTPWIELCRGALSNRRSAHPKRRPMAAAIISAFLLLACMCIAMTMRAHRYQTVVASNEREQQALFRQALPQQQIPQDIPSRLRSEEQRLRGASGKSAATPVPSRILSVPVLVLLRDSLGSLPAELPFQLNEIRFNDDHFTFQGSARTLADASALTDALRNQASLTVDGPMIQQSADHGVNFAINGAAKNAELRRVGMVSP